MLSVHECAAAAQYRKGVKWAINTFFVEQIDTFFVEKDGTNQYILCGRRWNKSIATFFVENGGTNLCGRGWNKSLWKRVEQIHTFFVEKVEQIHTFFVENGGTLQIFVEKGGTN